MSNCGKLIYFFPKIGVDGVLVSAISLSNFKVKNGQPNKMIKETRLIKEMLSMNGKILCDMSCANITWLRRLEL